MTTRSHNLNYCVYLTIYTGKKLPRRYIGSTSTNRVKVGYNGSVASKKYSVIFKEEQKSQKHLFNTRILQVFETREKALQYELELQLKYNVVSDPKYMNEAYAKPNGFFGRSVAGKLNPSFGKPHPNKGKKLPQTGNPGQKNAMYGKKGIEHPAFGYKKTDEAKKAIGDSLRGVKKSDEHRRNILLSREKPSYKEKVHKPIIVSGIYFESIKDALSNSGKTHNFIWSRLKNPDNFEVVYANGN